jgi:hypothetical protein
MSIRHFSLLAACLALTGGGVLSAALVTDRSIGEARIVRIENTPVADLVVLDSGYEAGLRQNMVCQVTRSGEAVGKLLLVELRSQTATALILNLNTGRSLLSGDNVTVQTVSTRNNQT